MNIAERLGSLAASHDLPGPRYLGELLDSAGMVLDSENSSIRPRDRDGLPGGLVLTDTPCVMILPDLHARTDLLPDLCGSHFPGITETTVESLLTQGRLSLICLGDVLHSEGRGAALRWERAAGEALRSQGPEGILSPEMDEEMGASLRTLCMVLELKRALPSVFHCLKGNHDNMANLSQDGDLSFYKYAAEGSMGAAWFTLRYGEELRVKMRLYERSLPLVAKGKRYCASHAEPAAPMGLDQIRNYRSMPEVVQGLIWTDNEEAVSGSVEKTMKSLFETDEARADWIWLSGHRAVAGNYGLRARGLLAQVHNPARRQVIILKDELPAKSPRAEIFTIHPGQGKTTPRLVFAESIALRTT